MVTLVTMQAVFLLLIRGPTYAGSAIVTQRVARRPTSI